MFALPEQHYLIIIITGIRLYHKSCMSYITLCTMRYCDYKATKLDLLKINYFQETKLDFTIKCSAVSVYLRTCIQDDKCVYIYM